VVNVHATNGRSEAGEHLVGPAPTGGASTLGALSGRAASRGRRVLPRRTLAGGRAVAGGFLIAVAAVLTFAAYTHAAHAPHQLYVVASRPLAPGTRLRSDDLTAVALDLPNPGVRRQVFESTGLLIGASVVAPINAGALVESSEIVGRGGPPGSREISLSVDRSRAVGGTLKPAEFVDVLGTFGGGADSYTSVMVPHVKVLTITAQGGGSLGDARTELIVFSVPDGIAAEAVADAMIATQVTLVRSAEQLDSAPVTTIATYRPPAAPGPVGYTPGAASAATAGGGATDGGATGGGAGSRSAGASGIPAAPAGGSASVSGGGAGAITPVGH